MTTTPETEALGHPDLRTYIVPAGQVTAIRNRLKQTDAPTGLDGMFLTALSQTPGGAVTHYVSSGHLSAEQVAFLDANLPKPFTGGEPGREPHALLARLGYVLARES